MVILRDQNKNVHEFWCSFQVSWPFTTGSQLVSARRQPALSTKTTCCVASPMCSLSRNLRVCPRGFRLFCGQQKLNFAVFFNLIEGLVCAAFGHLLICWFNSAYVVMPLPGSRNSWSWKISSSRSCLIWFGPAANKYMCGFHDKSWLEMTWVKQTLKSREESFGLGFGPWELDLKLSNYAVWVELMFLSSALNRCQTSSTAANSELIQKLCSEQQMLMFCGKVFVFQGSMTQQKNMCLEIVPVPTSCFPRIRWPPRKLWPQRLGFVDVSIWQTVTPVYMEKVVKAPFLIETS